MKLKYLAISLVSYLLVQSFGTVKSDSNKTQDVNSTENMENYKEKYELKRTLTSWEPILSVAFDIHSGLLASGSFTRIHIWNTTTGELMRTLTGHKYRVYCVAFDKNGLLASGSFRDIKLWNTTTGVLINTLVGGVNELVYNKTTGHYESTGGHSGSVKSVAFDKNGLLASGSEDSLIKLWNTTTGQLIKTLGGEYEKYIRYETDKKTNRKINTLGGHAYAVRTVAFDQKGLLASGSKDDTIKLWNTTSGQLLKTLDGYFSVYSLAFDQNGLLASGSSGDKTIKLWNTTNGLLLNTLEGHNKSNGKIYSIAFDQNGLLASSSSDNTIKLWNTTTGQCIDTLKDPLCKTNCVSKVGDPIAFDKNGLLASGSSDKNIKLWGKIILTTTSTTVTNISTSVTNTTYTTTITSTQRRQEVWKSPQQNDAIASTTKTESSSFAHLKSYANEFWVKIAVLFLVYLVFFSLAYNYPYLE